MGFKASSLALAASCLVASVAGAGEYYSYGAVPEELQPEAAKLSRFGGPETHVVGADMRQVRDDENVTLCRDTSMPGQDAPLLEDAPTRFEGAPTMEKRDKLGSKKMTEAPFNSMGLVIRHDDACGATLIDDDLIITSARCTDAKGEWVFHPGYYKRARRRRRRPHGKRGENDAKDGDGDVDPTAQEMEINTDDKTAVKVIARWIIDDRRELDLFGPLCSARDNVAVMQIAEKVGAKDEYSVMKVVETPQDQNSRNLFNKPVFKAFTYMDPEGSEEKAVSGNKISHLQPYEEKDLVLRGLTDYPHRPYYFSCYDGPYEVASHSYMMQFGSAVYTAAPNGEFWLYGVVAMKREEKRMVEAPATSSGKGKLKIPLKKKPEPLTEETRIITYLAAGEKMRALIARAKSEKK